MGVRVPLLLPDNMFEGYKVYERFHEKEGRWMVMLYHPCSKHRTTMSRARYRMCLYLNRELDPNEETVDHKDDDRTNDDINNLQLLSRAKNLEKSAKGLTMITKICPGCGKEFTRRKGNDKKCCSRSCGAKQRSCSSVGRAVD